MSINEIFSQRKIKYADLVRRRHRAEPQAWECPACHALRTRAQIRKELNICPVCRRYLPMSARERIELVCDEGSFKEMFSRIRSRDPLNFPGYKDKLLACREKTGQEEAFVAGICRIRNLKTAIGVLDGRFLMGSMGTAVGEKILRLTEFAGKKKLPLILFSASGGARMQEGLFSLMQMARTAAAVDRFKAAGGLFISCLTNPTTGGVSASYASLGDIILAEPDALICFAGPRVIEQTIGEKLPEGFQHAEFLLEHGQIDGIVERRQWKKTLYQLLLLHGVKS